MSLNNYGTMSDERLAKISRLLSKFPGFMLRPKKSIDKEFFGRLQIES